MNFIRSILPGGKHRMMSENKCLDISKITPRMYAMSYPSDNFFESMYHNNQDDIADYLNKNHPKKYLIFNLSGIPYQVEKFNNSVINYYWPDHKAPPLSDIFNIIFQAYNFLGKDKENVICIHCLAGKGRTGTICCSLLLYGKLLKCSQDANNYFSTKRFKKLNKGVQEPSQVRYIEYFDKMLYTPNFQGLDLTIYEITNVYVTGIKLNEGESITYKFETNYYKETDARLYLSQDKGQIVTGDVTINIYRNGKLKAWIFFNTYFIQPTNNKLFFHLKDIDPRFLLKEPDYSLMTIEVTIYPYYFNQNIDNNNSNNNLNQQNNINNKNNNTINNMNNNTNNNINNNINNNTNNNMNNNTNNNINSNNNNNMNNNINNNNNNKNNSLINDMLVKEMNKIRKMNEYLYYANTKNPNQFYQENKILFFGDENDDISEVLSQINNKK